jgi:hypothetical protein
LEAEVKKQKKVKGRREVNIHGYLLVASKRALTTAQESSTIYDVMTSMLHSAFCLEAYLNYLGKKKFARWDKIEPGMNTRAKLEFLAVLFGYEIDFSRKPFQTFSSIKRFRDMVVHGKPQSLRVDKVEELEDKEWPSEPETKWEQMCTLKNAQTFCDDVEAMMQELHSKSGLSDQDAFWTMGSSEYQIADVQ